MPMDVVHVSVDRQRGRRAHRKVKTGCLACKARRQKCDERGPRCAGCTRHSTVCIYPPPRSRGQLSRPVTTPKTLPPLSPSHGLQLDDLELLHQYLTSTSIATAQLPQATIQRQTVVPQLAQTHRFVMHGILAQAAIHLSWLRPERKMHYIFLAAKHHSVALPDFRHALQDMTEANHHALIIFSKGLIWCSFAWYEMRLGQEQTMYSSTTEDSWLPHWFQRLRGSCLIVNACTQWVKGNQYLLPPPLDELSEFSISFDCYQLSILKTRLAACSRSPLCEMVLEGLVQAFARASMRHHNTPLRNAMNFWAGMIPNEYISLLHAGEPWALVILAHFCILVSRSETRWFMMGHATQLLDLIRIRLPEVWEEYLQWPFDEVGFSPGTAGFSLVDETVCSV